MPAARPCFGPRALVVSLLLATVSGCFAPSEEQPEARVLPAVAPRSAVAAVLDDWHQAASAADAARYMGHFSQEARFLGTDAGERWDREGFAVYVNHFFVGEGRGWTYLPRDRHVEVSRDGSLAWFDELLDNDGYGELRGSGVLRLEPDGVWRIAQYSMTFTVPNGVARDVVARIRTHQAAAEGDQ